MAYGLINCTRLLDITFLKTQLVWGLALNTTRFWRTSQSMALLERLNFIRLCLS